MTTFVKHDPAPLEAAGLRWLAEAGARVPDIVSARPGRLELRRIDGGRLAAGGEEELGRMLATVHAAGAPRFGSLPAPGAFLVGRCELDSPEGDDWNDYYLQHRCLPLARRVGLDREVAEVRVEAPVEPVARLHGDLWSGNVLADTEGRPWLIDPAAYGGHREMDLAMLDLFGTIPARTAAAYDEVAPLADGWRERIPLWQLFPLLVHAVLFGGGYRRSAHDLAVRLAR
ncbi:Fructosamine-3-kinase [Jatrophihabitans endophyticus]|uniref:Fructosamine-3-kinase n=1 Tax=Jatrophihabitans endophyticus TaxID=1206085 RepID=A0A1M5KMK6_9ACTN|nr:fructosamine kinase family protein [Jatrophihabitans endophyticus]SHG53991.1 Fructosamine-3-kinase [Jatrophihabitans endophyticus]